MQTDKRIDFNAMMQVKGCRDRLTVQQYKTLRGQVLAGDGDGALRGLRKLLLKQQGRGSKDACICDRSRKCAKCVLRH